MRIARRVGRGEGRRWSGNTKVGHSGMSAFLQSYKQRKKKMEKAKLISFCSLGALGKAGHDRSISGLKKSAPEAKKN